MNRRSFLRALGAVPVVAVVPAALARFAPAAGAMTASGFRMLGPDGSVPLEVSDGVTTVRHEGGRTEFRKNRMDVFDSRGVLRISFGDLS
ncbi:hypothetical protein [Stenotrophomonas maltophilia]|uniref:hypothetical protein n=1 Tax=Stenotrophomonas maltophilia TaxID=40324 RepID=UPI0012D9564D|nr:hypothetical protein [Stenotrophomonas maltophilia]